MAKRRLLVVVLGLLLFTIATAPVYANRGNGKGNGNKETPSATLTVECDPCQVGVNANFTGDGYDASQGRAQVYVGNAFMVVPVFSDGTVAFDWPYFSVPGEYSVRVYQDGKGKKVVLKAQTLVTVAP